MNKLLIYTNGVSNRLSYTFDLLLTDLLGLNYELTSDKDFFSASGSAKFSYATAPVGNEIFFEAATLLFEVVNTPQPINFCEYEKINGFYPVSAESKIPFDLFASTFFMVTRYEEYFSSNKDKYERYRPSSSMNYKGDFLEKPMVNYYALELKKILSEKFPELVFKKIPFLYIPTFDIDMAYSYLHKGAIKNIGGFIRSIMLSDFKEFKERALVLWRKQKDPFDTYRFIFKVLEENLLKSIFFFLLGDDSRLDKNISYENEEFRELIKYISEKTETGIHLSYKSHTSTSRTEMEIERLVEIIGKRTVRNRYHFLRFHIPNSYLRLVRVGITEEYSMGYASKIGFRAGICTPYYFFNIKSNEVTPLKIFPFAFMDTTLAYYNKLDAETATHQIRQLMRSVHETGGTFYGLWHNSSFTEQKEWTGYRKVFETIAEEAAALMHQP